MKQWFVYMVRCVDGSLYTGITTDVVRRVAEHNSTGDLAAKYTRARQPVSLVYSEPMESHSTASQREYQLKRLSKKDKESLILSQST
ncbi:MAG: endonuclease [Proteobacteria bacterium]|nr:MAG: endonuclease [Pseudomonadota bacterium]